MPNVQHKRGTKAALDALAASSSLVPHQVYYLTDKNRIAIPVTASTYVVFSRETKKALAFTIDGGGQAIAAGQAAYAEAPFDANVLGWTILADQAGDAVVDIRRGSYSSFPTTVSLAGTEKPTLAAAQKNQDTALGSWTATLSEGDILKAVVDSATTVQQLTVVLILERL